MKFLVNAADVIADGVNAHAELIGNLLVGQSLGQAVNDRKFALGERYGIVTAPNPQGLKGLNYFAGNRRRHWRAALTDFGYRLEQFLWRHALEQIARCSRGEGTEDLLSVLKDGEHQDLRLGHDGFEAPDAFNAVHA